MLIINAKTNATILHSVTFESEPFSCLSGSPFL